MGVLQRFERRLEGLVEGAFARVFGGAVQPAEVAAALQREAAHNKAVVAAGRVLVPNDYVVELGGTDADRLEAYDAPLRRELAAMVGEHAQEQGWSFVGPVGVRFERVPTLGTGTFRIRSSIVAGQDPLPLPGPAATGPVLVLSDREVALGPTVTVVGRGAEADIRLVDTGVSRRHAELHRDPNGTVVLLDAGSTNGTLLNGRKVHREQLSDGDQVQVGTTTMTFRETATPAVQAGA